MVKNLGIIALFGCLFYFEWSLWLIPVWVLIAELWALKLDRQSTQNKAQVSLQKPGKYTAEELSKHNTADSLWAAVEGKVYDISSYLNQHPGGKEFLLLHAGRDCTVPFKCYHPFTDKPKQVLEKFFIGELTTFDTPQFPKDTGFYKECCDRIKLYFKEHNIDYKSPLPGLMRAIPLYILMAILYYKGLLDRDTSLFARLTLGILYGVCQALNAIHLMHDASHGAVGNSEKWWFGVGRLTLDWISGSSMLAWHNQHIVGHHAYTNIMGKDPDLPYQEAGDVRRLLPQQVWNKMYEWQVYYMPPLYGLLTLRSRWYDIFEIFYFETNGPVKVNPISKQDKFRQSATKLFWFFWRVFLPMRMCGIDAMTSILLFLVTEFSCGYWLAFNFQVSHVSDQAEYYHNKLPINEEWAVLQVKSSVDYGHESPLQTYLSGALNYQVVHHLFPGVSQYLYPEIAPIIKDVCKKHKIRYNHLPGIWEALQSHLSYLRIMGEKKEWVKIE